MYDDPQHCPFAPSSDQCPSSLCTFCQTLQRSADTSLHVLLLVALDLLELTSDGTCNELGGVGVGEEAGGVGLEILDGEAGRGVNTVGKHTSGEWALETSVGVSELEVLTETALGVDRVGEGETGGTSETGTSLVDVGSGLGGGLVLSSDEDGDVLQGQR